MGADIHMYLERKYKGEWVGVHAFPAIPKVTEDSSYAEHVWWDVEGRYYALFAALAGVRGDGPAPKGLPADASPLTLMDYDRWSGDAHSASWYSVRDFLKIYCGCARGEREKKAYLSDLMEGGDVWLWRAADRYLGYLDEDHLDDYRIVFWFDN